jgi:hypothetical protein
MRSKETRTQRKETRARRKETRKRKKEMNKKTFFNVFFADQPASTVHDFLLRTNSSFLSAHRKFIC